MFDRFPDRLLYITKTNFSFMNKIWKDFGTDINTVFQQPFT